MSPRLVASLFAALVAALVPAAAFAAPAGASSAPAAPAPEPTPVTVAQLLQNEKFLAGVAEHVRTPRHGFFVMKDGQLTNFYGSDGVVRIARAGRFVFQGGARRPDGSVGHFHAGMIGDPGSRAELKPARAAADTPAYTLTILHPRASLRVGIECLARGVRLTYFIEGLDLTDGGGRPGVGLLFPITFSPGAVPPRGAFAIEDFPLVVPGRDGRPVTVRYDPELYAPYGNGGKGVFNGNAEELTFYVRFDQAGAAAGGPPQRTLKFEFGLP